MIDRKFLKALITHYVPFITFGKDCSSKENLFEYRPIAIIPFLLKAFERLGHNEVSRQLENNNMHTYIHNWSLQSFSQHY